MTRITPDTLARALSYARGQYQRGLLCGARSWSGRDIRGRPDMYAPRYAASRESLLRRLRAAGFTVRVIDDIVEVT